MVFDPLLRELRRERIEHRLERARDFERVRAELRRGFDEDAGFAADHRIAEARLGAVDDLRDVAEPDRRAVARRDDRLRERFGRRAGSLRLHDDALRRRLDVAAADQLGRAARRLGDVLQREPERGELQRIDLDAPLAHFAAEKLRLRNARHRKDLRLDDPFDEIAQLER